MDDVDWSDEIMQEEIFGPILPILEMNDLEASLAKLREYEKPLAAYLFTEDKAEQDLFLTRYSFGGGCINDTIMHVTNPKLPFGGVGNSGTGNYHGEAG